MDEYFRSCSQNLVEIINTVDNPEATYQQKTLIDTIASVSYESAFSVEEVRNLLCQGVDPSAADFLHAVDQRSDAGLSSHLPAVYFSSPIFHTVMEPLPKITELLLAYNADPNPWTRSYGYDVVSPSNDIDQTVWMTPAHVAVYVGSEKCLQSLINFGADVNARIHAVNGTITEDVGYTPLHIASRGKVLKCMKLLLDHGADLCATDAKGQTSLHLAAKHGRWEVVMTLLDWGAGNPTASLFIPTLEGDTVLHACLRGGRIEMTECIKELVRRGADVCFHNIHHESPVGLAVTYKWSLEIIELLIFQSHSMDFDRQQPTGCSPLERAVWRPRPLRPDTLVVRYRHESGSYPEWDDSLAVLLLQMGASRENLEGLLFYELNREEAGSRLLEILMDSFAYLPSLSQLEHNASTPTLHCLQRDYDHDRLFFSVPPDLASYAERRHKSKCAQKFFLASIMLMRRGLLFNNYSVRYLPRKNAVPETLVQNKKEEYCRRQREIPALVHLCRSTIRRTLKADVRKVVSFPIPTLFKEYILLGYPIEPQDQKGGENSSSERGNPTAGKIDCCQA